MELNNIFKLADSGRRLFPVASDTKLPCLKMWPDEATTNKDTLTSWFGEGGEFTHAQIGICPGEEFFVLDVDVKKGKVSGKQALAELQARGLPKTYTVTTPSGGLHLYYKKPTPGFIISRTGWKPGIDIRANRGQVVAPGSTFKGKEYKVLFDIPMSMYPTDLYAEIPFKNGTESTVAKSLISAAPPDTSPYSTMPDVLERGGRDAKVYGYACSWRTRGVSFEMAKILMKDLHSRCEQVPGDEFTIDEAMEKLDRAYDQYEPHAQREPVVPAAERVVEAPAVDAEPEDAKSFLTNFVLIEDGALVADLRKHVSISIIKLADFKVATANKFRWDDTDDKPKKINLCKEWLEHPERQTCRNIGYKPLGDAVFMDRGEPFYNTYYGSGQVLPEVYDMAKVNVFLEHIKYMMPKKSDAMVLLNWFAYTLQRPDKRIPWCPLIISEEGVGKGWMHQVMEMCTGKHNSHIVSAREFRAGNQFNEFMYESTIVLIDDVREENIDIINALKTVITGHTLMINRKYGAKRKEDVYANIIMFSNYLDAIRIVSGDRHYWVHHVKEGQKDAAYYNEKFDWLFKTDGPAHLEKFLRSIDLTGYDFAAKPETTLSKKQMVAASKDNIETLIDDAINRSTC